MSPELIVKYCAPTLAGLKAGSLFSCDCPRREALCMELRAFNRQLVPRGVRILPLRCREGRALIYAYRPGPLRAVLSAPDSRRILQEAGYGALPAERCIPELIARLREQGGFPHEIGLFLGYPARDVRGFLQNGGRNCRYSGLWKVYGSESAARARFAFFKKCTDSYSKKLAEGVPLEELARPLRRAGSTI